MSAHAGLIKRQVSDLLSPSHSRMKIKPHTFLAEWNEHREQIKQKAATTIESSFQTLKLPSYEINELSTAITSPFKKEADAGLSRIPHYNQQRLQKIRAIQIQTRNRIKVSVSNRSQYLNEKPALKERAFTPKRKFQDELKTITMSIGKQKQTAQASKESTKENKISPFFDILRPKSNLESLLPRDKITAITKALGSTNSRLLPRSYVADLLSMCTLAEERLGPKFYKQY